jgi:hypothetical protein
METTSTLIKLIKIPPQKIDKNTPQKIDKNTPQKSIKNRFLIGNRKINKNQ